jgi:hypothetical protein
VICLSITILVLLLNACKTERATRNSVIRRPSIMVAAKLQLLQIHHHFGQCGWCPSCYPWFYILPRSASRTFSIPTLNVLHNHMIRCRKCSTRVLEHIMHNSNKGLCHPLLVLAAMQQSIPWQRDDNNYKQQAQQHESERLCHKNKIKTIITIIIDLEVSICCSCCERWCW